jgi:hypothetical protein
MKSAYRTSQKQHVEVNVQIQQLPKRWIKVTALGCAGRSSLTFSVTSTLPRLYRETRQNQPVPALIAEKRGVSD